MNAEFMNGCDSARGGAVISDWPVVRAQHLPGATRLPHVCFVAPNIWPVFSRDPEFKVAGGAEVQQSILARLLVRNGYQVSIVCADWGQPARLVRDGISVVKTYRMRDGLPVIRFIHPRLTRIWRALREVNADIYYQRAAGMLTAVVAAYCRRHRKLSIYAGASNTDFIPGQQLIEHRRDRWLFEQGLAAVDAVVVQNEPQKRLCAEHYGRDATLIPSCYELPEGANPGRGDYVLWVAAIRRTKRPELLLEMARRLPGRRFVMIGGPSDPSTAGLDYFAQIRRSAAALPNVEFVGFLPLDQVEPYFDRARLVINTSEAHREGMPNVFLQAWARAVPTLAFHDTGASLAGDSLYPVARDVGTAAAITERMFADDIFRARYASRCHEHFVQTHGPATVLDRYQRLFRDLERATAR